MLFVIHFSQILNFVCIHYILKTDYIFSILFGKMDKLKECIAKYQDADEALQTLNRQVHAKREDRKKIEAELTEIVKLPQFESISKLKLEDGSTIKIERPGGQKAWCLSKKDLKEHLDSLFGSDVKSSEQLYERIVKKQQEKLVSQDYTFSRT